MIVFISLMLPTAPDKLAPDKLASDKLALRKSASDNLALYKSALRKLALYKSALRKLASDKLASDKLASDKLALYKLALRKSALASRLAHRPRQLTIACGCVKPASILYCSFNLSLPAGGGDLWGLSSAPAPFWVCFSRKRGSSNSFCDFYSHIKLFIV